MARIEFLIVTFILFISGISLFIQIGNIENRDKYNVKKKPYNVSVDHLLKKINLMQVKYDNMNQLYHQNSEKMKILAKNVESLHKSSIKKSVKLLRKNSEKVRPNLNECYNGYEGPEYYIKDVNYNGRKFKLAIYKRISTQSDIVSNHIKSHGFWDAKTSNVILGQMKTKTGTFVDIGANIGWFSFLMAVSGYKVYAIEPFESNVNLMRLSLCLNPSLSDHLTIYHTGLDIKSKSCEMWQQPRVNLGDTHSICDGEFTAKSIRQSFIKNGYQKVGVMNTKSLDDMVSNGDLALNGRWVVKIDTEGYEANVFMGAKSILETNPPDFIATEFSSRMLNTNGPDYSKKYANILDQRYNIYHANKKMRPSDIIGGNFELLECKLK